MEIPQVLVLVLPLIVTALSAWLSHNGLPAWINALISGVVTLLCAIGWSLIDRSLASDLVADIVLIASYCAALMAGPLKPLHQWLMVTLPSPLAGLASSPPAATTMPSTSSQSTASTQTHDTINTLTRAVPRETPPKALELPTRNLASPPGLLSSLSQASVSASQAQPSTYQVSMASTAPMPVVQTPTPPPQPMKVEIIDAPPPSENSDHNAASS